MIENKNFCIVINSKPVFLFIIMKISGQFLHYGMSLNLPINFQT